MVIYRVVSWSGASEGLLTSGGGFDSHTTRMKVELKELLDYLVFIGQADVAIRVKKKFSTPSDSFKREYYGSWPQPKDCGNRSCGAVECPTCGPIRQ